MKYNEENENNLDTVEGQIAALWARVNYLLDALMDKSIIRMDLSGKKDD